MKHTVSAWQLWKCGEVLRILPDIEPRVASWNKKTDPEQIRVQSYLDELEAKLTPLPMPVGDLFLHMDIDVQLDARLTHHYDLENYLTPVVYRLGAHRFTFVSAEKRVGGGSRLLIGRVEPLDAADGLKEWEHVSCRAGSGTEKTAWKANIRHALAAACSGLLPPGPVEVHLAWRCSPARNWVSLWKPTGNAMGPVLGEPYANKPFYPNDDRIVRLGLHLNLDKHIGHEVDVGMWWRTTIV